MNQHIVEMVRERDGHRLSINLSELADALDNGSYEMMYFFDMETGEVMLTTAEEDQQLEEIFAEIEGEGNDVWAAFEAALRRRDLPEWLEEAVRRAAHVEAEFGTRYRRIQRDDPHSGYRDMESFIGTVGNARLQNRLDQAISGRGAFRRFKDVLYDYPAERERWFQFQSDRLREQALGWLREEGIVPVENDAEEDVG